MIGSSRRRVWGRRVWGRRVWGHSVWDQGEAYEPYIGRWSRPVARRFVAWLGRPPGAYWVDVGCGTGALTEAILAQAEPAEVVGVEPSEGYLAVARRQVVDPRVRFETGNAYHLPVGSAASDAVVSGLVLNFIPDASMALTEMARVTKAGGIIAAYVWDYADKMELMRYFWDAAVALKPEDRRFDEGVRFPICRPEPLRDLFAGAGLLDVETSAIDVPTIFENFDDYWTPFLGGQFPAPDYTMSLPEADRIALREHLRATLPVSEDGRIRLVARAWAVRGRHS